MRGLVASLGTASPIAAQLPPVFTEDDYTMDFVGALDRVLAAPLSSLDNLTAYLDPATAPDDFLAWLGHWVALGPSSALPADNRLLRRRTLAAAQCATRRGTADALANELSAWCGHVVAIEDSGGVIVHDTAADPFRDPARDPVVTVVVPGHADPSAVLHRARALVPAHITLSVRLTPSDDVDPTTAPESEPAPILSEEQP